MASLTTRGGDSSSNKVFSRIRSYIGGLLPVSLHTAQGQILVINRLGDELLRLVIDNSKYPAQLVRCPAYLIMMGLACSNPAFGVIEVDFIAIQEPHPIPLAFLRQPLKYRDLCNHF
jgi:hypothetical protein